MTEVRSLLDVFKIKSLSSLLQLRVPTPPFCNNAFSWDPIGLAGGLNVYQYAPNPLGWVDPWGLSADDLIVPSTRTNLSSKIEFPKRSVAIKAGKS
jgi:hypothetical protein